MTDRLFEADADIIFAIGDNGMSVPDAGKWTALAVCIGPQVAWAARGFLNPPRIAATAKGKAKFGPPKTGSAAKLSEELSQLLAQGQQVGCWSSHAA